VGNIINKGAGTMLKLNWDNKTIKLADLLASGVHVVYLGSSGMELESNRFNDIVNDGWECGLLVEKHSYSLGNVYAVATDKHGDHYGIDWQDVLEAVLVYMKCNNLDSSLILGENGEYQVWNFELFSVLPFNTKYNRDIIRRIRRSLDLDLNDHSKDIDIMRMSRDEVFERILAQMFGRRIQGYDKQFKSWIEDIYKVELKNE
jgi:hypothetical protein